MKFLSFATLFALFLLTISCEKVIEIELPNNEPALVIEGYLEEDSLCYVQLSSTIDIFDGKLPPFITDAVITISDNQGNSEILLYQDFGVYRGVMMRGLVGNTYTLSVSTEGKEYLASSTILPVVPIDSMRVIEHYNPSPANITNYKSARLYYTDPSGSKNSYLAKFFYFPSPTNDEAVFIERKYLLNDDNRNGQADSLFLFSQPIESGDAIVVELRSIDQAVFDYYFTMEDALTGNSFTSAAPANPKSNFSNGALGYFGAWSKDLEFFIVP